MYKNKVPKKLAWGIEVKKCCRLSPCKWMQFGYTTGITYHTTLCRLLRKLSTDRPNGYPNTPDTIVIKPRLAT